jgi:hypothetical protein
MMINTNTTFSPEAISDAAQGNVSGLCYGIIAYMKERGLSPNECWAFIGRKFSTAWAPGSVEDIARGAAINMVSAGCTLQALSADEARAEAVMTGWPAAAAATRFGLTQAEADTVFDIFGPIISALGAHYQWQRRGETIVMTFTR